MNNALRRSEEKAFQRAIALHMVAPFKTSGPAATMMRLAFEADAPLLRVWATRWLENKCNLIIVSNPAERASDAIAAATANLH